MKAATLLAAGILAAPFAAIAQTSYSQARIAEPAVRVDYGACMNHSDSLADRRAFLDQERYAIEAAAADIAREGETLRLDLARLPTGDAAAVAAYNARSADHNRRVAAHNRRVAEMNGAAASLNSESADMLAYCNLRTYRWRDDVTTFR
jgi:hypothetical protein